MRHALGALTPLCEAQQRAKAMTPAEVDQLKAHLQAQLPAAIQQILAQCAKENWPVAARKCVLDATTLADATKCT